MTLSANGGVSFTTNYVDGSDVAHAGLYAIIDATADPTTTAQAYTWDYTSAADDNSTYLSQILTVVAQRQGGSPTTPSSNELADAIEGIARYLKLPID